MLDQQTIDIEEAGLQADQSRWQRGPFVFKEWIQGDHLSFDRNPNYWQSGKPYLDGLQANVRDIQSATVQLEAGALQLIRNPLVDDTAAVGGRPRGFQKILHPNPWARFSSTAWIAASLHSTTRSSARRSTTPSIGSGWSICTRATSTSGRCRGARARRRFDATKNMAFAFRSGQSQVLAGSGRSDEPDHRQHHHQRGRIRVQETFLQVYQIGPGVHRGHAEPQARGRGHVASIRRTMSSTRACGPQVTTTPT